jgi:CRISPR-associated protein Cas5t
MKAVKVIAWQDMVCYRKPSSFILRESYPLPPFSTVIGMVHNACGYKEYVPMKVSVKGSYDSSIIDNFTAYEFKFNGKYENGRHNVAISYNGEKYGLVRGMLNTELLCDVKLLLHIVPEDQSKLDEIYQGICNPPKYLFLGRHEDILRIDDIRIVNLIEDMRAKELGYNTYIPVEKANNISGTVYRINKNYSVDKTSSRIWQEQIEAVYASENSSVMRIDVNTWDEDGEIVFLV